MNIVDRIIAERAAEAELSRVAYDADQARWKPHHDRLRAIIERNTRRRNVQEQGQRFLVLTEPASFVGDAKIRAAEAILAAHSNASVCRDIGKNPRLASARWLDKARYARHEAMERAGIDKQPVEATRRAYATTGADLVKALSGLSFTPAQRRAA